MMKSLLSKTLSQFVICTLSIFVLTTPLFYLLTKHFYAEEMIDVIEAVGQGKSIPPMDLERDIMAGVMLQFLLIFMVISISLYITVRFIIRRLWHPFDDTLQKTEQFNLAQGDLPQFTETRIKEFARLNHSLKELMEKDKETFRIQREFTENASHELQTPLAVTRSKLDLLLQEEQNEQTMHIISDLYELNTRMEHLNRSLLLLAKIENSQYINMENIDIEKCINKLLTTYHALQHRVNITLHNHRTQSAHVYANITLLESMLNNLIVNAIRHTHTDNGDIIISLHDKYITVSNPADGEKLISADLFRRFRSGDAKSVGNGLGLSIVKAICDFHGWEVSYLYQENRHLFVVNFY